MKKFFENIFDILLRTKASLYHQEREYKCCPLIRFCKPRSSATKSVSPVGRDSRRLGILAQQQKIVQKIAPYNIISLYHQKREEFLDECNEQHVILSEAKDLMTRDASAVPQHDELRHPEQISRHLYNARHPELNRHPERSEGSNDKRRFGRENVVTLKQRCFELHPQHDELRHLYNARHPELKRHPERSEGSPNQKAAFSLIEILQTVVLLGIIAGLSVSFFAKFSSDDKLFYATERMLAEAVQEAQRQMCNDKTPICVSARDANNVPTAFANWADNCAEQYTGSAYNPTTGYCEITVANVADTCTVAGMKKDTKNAKVCIGDLLCNVGFERLAVPNSERICPQGTVDLSVSVNSFADSYISNEAGHEGETVNVDINVTSFCNGMYNILNHKTQNSSKKDDDFIDLRHTCDAYAAQNSDKTQAFTSNTILSNDADRDILDVKSSPHDSRYSMLLSNGVRLYNLGGAFAGPPPAGRFSDGSTSQIKVFIKYDRLNELSTLILDDTDHSIGVDALDPGDTTRARNIKDSNIWCVWIGNHGEVKRCDLGE